MKTRRFVQRSRTVRRRLSPLVGVAALCVLLLMGLVACDSASTPPPAGQATNTSTTVSTPTEAITTATLAPSPTSTPVSHTLAITFTVTIDVVDCPSAQPTGTICINVSGSGSSSVYGTVKLSRSAVLSPPGDDSCGPSTTSGKLTMSNGDTATFTATGQFCRSNSTATYTYTITGGTGRFKRATGMGSIIVPRLTDSPTPHESWNGTLIPGA